MKPSQRKYRLPNHPVLGYNRYHDEDEFDRGEEWFILGLGFVIWGVYWGLVHLADKFTFNFIPWWIEPLTACLLYTSPRPRDQRGSRMPSSA